MHAASLVTVHADGARAIATLSRPQALNALTPELLDELGDALERLSREPDVVAVVLTGEGRAFSAGMSQRLPALVGPARARWLSYTATDERIAGSH